MRSTESACLALPSAVSSRGPGPQERLWAPFVAPGRSRSGAAGDNHAGSGKRHFSFVILMTPLTTRYWPLMSVRAN